MILAYQVNHLKCIGLTGLLLIPLLCNQSAFAVVYNLPPAIFGDNKSINAGDVLNVFDNGQVGWDFDAPSGSFVNIYGGTIGDNFNTDNATVAISGGDFGFFAWFTNSTIDMTGGSTSEDFLLRGESTMNMSGGSIGEVSAMSNSTLNLSGGFIGNYFTLWSGILNVSGGSVGHTLGVAGSNIVDAEINISGGSFGHIFVKDRGNAEINVLGSAFALDGVPIAGLVPGVPHIVSDREVTLTAVLADGSPYEFNLFTEFSEELEFDRVSSNTTISVVLIPEPTSLLLIVMASAGLLVRRR